MFNIGDLIIYSGHGICQIDEICDKSIIGVTKKYYVLHPVQDLKLTISTPVDNDTVVMLALINKNEAEKILESFKRPGIEWIEKSSQRSHIYYEIVNAGNRKEISKIVNTLMRKKHEIEMSGKKFHESDRKLLTFVSDILFAELAISLDTTFEEIFDRVTNLISLEK